VRDAEIHRQAFALTPHYLEHTDKRTSVESTQRRAGPSARSMMGSQNLAGVTPEPIERWAPAVHFNAWSAASLYLRTIILFVSKKLPAESV
jgi:hypothetical protein